MPTAFIPGYTPRVQYNVMMKQNGKWRPYAPCHAYRNAELAACALVTKPDVTEAHIVRRDVDSSRIVARLFHCFQDMPTHRTV